jgi:ankyrin repeat protein
MPDATGQLPLHLAAAHGASVPVISCLLHANPRAASHPDDDGAMPLHVAATSAACGAVVKRLLQAYPRAASVILTGGMLPLHLAARHGAPADTIEALIGAHLQGVHQQSDGGYLPLHCATEAGASASVVDVLLRFSPSASRSRTRTGKLPLQLIARRGFVDADAEDISTRRSTCGSTLHSEELRISADMSLSAAMVTARTPACIHSISDAHSHGQGTARAPQTRSPWSVLRIAFRGEYDCESAGWRGHDRRCW